MNQYDYEEREYREQLIARALRRKEEREKNPNPSDSWIAPEHAKMGQGMRRPKRGIRDKDGLYIVKPGERIIPEPSSLRQQRQTEWRLGH